MTKLFLNNPRHIAMDNRQQINSGLSKANKTIILGQIKSVFFQHFEQSVDDFCMRIDAEFGLQLGKNREKISKDQYMKLLDYLRSVRKDIKQNYLFKVSDMFDDSYKKTANNQGGQIDFSKVSLISDDVVQESHAITQIVRQCEHLFYEELASLNKHLAISQGKQTIADSQNPIFPEKLVRALVEVVKPLKLNADGRITLYKAFEVNVFSQLGFIYRELIKCCETATTTRMQDDCTDAGGRAPTIGALGDTGAVVEVEQGSGQRRGAPSSTQLYVVGEIKEEVGPASTRAEQPSVEFGLLQKKLELWRCSHSPSAYDLMPVHGNAFYEHFEIKNALQILQQFNDDSDPDEKQQPLKWRLLRKLEELSFSDKVKNLNQHDEDVLDLAALIFSEIERDELLQDAIKTAVLQLEIPMSSASLGRYSIFINQDNPVRQLLDDLFSAGLFLNADEYDDRLIQERITSAVNKITQEGGFEFSGWSTEAGEFSNYLNKQKLRSRSIEENAKQFMINKQVLASNRKIVLITIENSLQAKPLPIAIVEFLRNVWSEVLLVAYAGKDERPEQWEKSVQAMDELIVSVMPAVDDHARKQILKLLPGLIAQLRHGLKQISYDKSAQSRFFKDLAVWHIILMDKKEAKKSTGDMVENCAIPEKIKVAVIVDDSSEQIRNLALESWVLFNAESGKQWGKLIWQDAATENLLFVGKNGVKMFEIQADELAKKLRLGQAAIVKINEKTITERVLSELMGL